MPFFLGAPMAAIPDSHRSGRYTRIAHREDKQDGSFSGRVILSPLPWPLGAVSALLHLRSCPVLAVGRNHRRSVIANRSRPNGRTNYFKGTESSSRREIE